MGLVFANIQVSREDGMGDRVDVDEVMVDTGSAHTVLPKTLLDSLRVQPVDFHEVEYGDGSTAVVPLGQVRIQIKGFEPTLTCPVYYSESGQQLLGATTLEIFNLMVDPVQDGLVRRPPIRARQF